MYQVGVRPSFATGFAQWPGMSEYPQLWEGLVAAYAPFLGITGNKVFDLSGNGLTGTISGAIWTVGNFGPALEFDGSDGKVTINDSTLIQNIFTGGGTISVWINPHSDGEGDYGRIFDKSAENTVGWWLIVNSEAGGYVKTRLGRYSDGDNGAWETTNAVIPIGTLTHLAVTFDDSNINNLPSIYINGIVQAITEMANPSGNYLSDAGQNITIGNNETSPSNRTFDGLIDVPALYNRILSASEIALFYEMMMRMAG